MGKTKSHIFINSRKIVIIPVLHWVTLRLSVDIFWDHNFKRKITDLLMIRESRSSPNTQKMSIPLKPFYNTIWQLFTQSWFQINQSIIYVCYLRLSNTNFEQALANGNIIILLSLLLILLLHIKLTCQHNFLTPFSYNKVYVV